MVSMKKGKYQVQLCATQIANQAQAFTTKWCNWRPERPKIKYKKMLFLQDFSENDQEFV